MTPPAAPQHTGATSGHPMPAPPLHPAPDAQQKDVCDLHWINTLFAHLTGYDLYLAAQIRDAIRFHLEEQAAALSSSSGTAAPAHAAQSDKTSGDTFHAAASKLLQKCLGQHFPTRGFYHWDAAQHLAAATPLFARHAILAGLQTLAPYRAATLLITNLRAALLPPTPRRRATTRDAKRLRDYEELVDFIRTLSATHAAPDSQLQLLFL